MGIKTLLKDKKNTKNDLGEWGKEGKDADSKSEVKPVRKQISVYLNADKIQEIKIKCATHNIKLNDFYEDALLEKLKTFKK